MNPHNHSQYCLHGGTITVDNVKGSRESSVVCSALLLTSEGVGAATTSHLPWEDSETDSARQFEQGYSRQLWTGDLSGLLDP